MRLRKLLVPAVVVALAVTACGGDDSPSAADETPTGSETGDEMPEDDAGSTADAEEFSEGENEAGVADTGADGEDVDTVALFTAIADATVAEGSYEFEATTGVGGMDSTATGAIQVGSTLDESNMRMRITSLVASSGGGTTSVGTTVRVVDDRFFVEITENMPQAGEGSWLMVDAAGDDPFLIIKDSRGVPTAGAIDDIRSVNDMVADLTESPDMVTATRVGTAEVDGVATTEYHVVVNDIAGFLDSGDEKIAELNGGLSYSIWVGDDLIRKIVTAGINGYGTTEMTYLNYGMNVEVEAPTANEVVDLSEYPSGPPAG